MEGMMIESQAVARIFAISGSAHSNSRFHFARGEFWPIRASNGQARPLLEADAIIIRPTYQTARSASPIRVNCSTFKICCGNCTEFDGGHRVP